ncbi:MAG TPA: vWA domain-containing protein [Polyangiaceae bacterium]|nr:vWA domain-containing protein [Polyangiaceae bacterium]
MTHRLPAARCWVFAALATPWTGCGGNDAATFGAGSGATTNEGGAVVNIAKSDASLSLGSPEGGLVGAVGSTSFEDAACARETRQAAKLPLDMYIMLDSSYSMLEPASVDAGAGNTKWSAVTAALKAFVNDAASAGIGVGLQYFPLTQPGVPEECLADSDCGPFGPCGLVRVCSDSDTRCDVNADCPAGQTCELLGLCGLQDVPCTPVGARCSVLPNDRCNGFPGYCQKRDLCDVAAYAKPAVNIAVLPGAAPALVASLTAHVPAGLTPTSAALGGAISHAQSLSAKAQNHKVVVVLATDGEPTECAPTEVASVARQASEAFRAAPSVATFVVGVFSPAEAAVAKRDLDSIARSGGTSQAFLVNTGTDVTVGFRDALNAIRTTALGCEYAIPKPDGGTLDYNLVNVRFTSGAGQTSTLGYAGSQAGCTARGGWYYDKDPSAGAPTAIQICEATCSTLKADIKGQVNVLLGCTTQAVVN